LSQAGHREIDPGYLCRLWWRIAGEPELWLWPRRVEFLSQYDPANVLRLKHRLDPIGDGESGTEWFRDRETAQVWQRTVAPWEFWEIEIWNPAASVPTALTGPNPHTPTGV
jgi:hypothetical protein